jgi:hypothetical protein
LNIYVVLVVICAVVYEEAEALKLIAYLKRFDVVKCNAICALSVDICGKLIAVIHRHDDKVILVYGEALYGIVLELVDYVAVRGILIGCSAEYRGHTEYDSGNEYEIEYQYPKIAFSCLHLIIFSVKKLQVSKLGSGSL